MSAEEKKLDPIAEMERVARKIRGKVIAMSHAAAAPHLGSALSCVDILVAAYWGALKVDPSAPHAPNRDRLILSKGHAAAALYAALAFRGFYPESWLDAYGRDGGRFPQHPGVGCAPGVEAATGSLGHGLPLAAGMALASRVSRRDYSVVAVMSDGECNEGTVWEAAMFAAARKLNHLTAIVDYNKWQATGRSNEVLALQPLAEKWRSFGWDAHEVDGHDLASLSELLARPPDPDGRPRAVVAHTIKGKGVSFMEDDNNWHYRIPTAEEVERAHAELRLL